MRGIMTNGPDNANPPRIAVFTDTENDGAVQIAKALAAEVAADFGPPGGSPVAVVATDEDGAVVGGLNGGTHWGWLYIRHLWVDAAWRRRGLGRQLLDRAEAEARTRGCAGLYVDTFSPVASRFYEHAGYERFGRIADFPPGHARTFLLKRL